MKTVFIRVLEATDKAAALRGAIRNLEVGQYFKVNPAKFDAVPRSPFAYWITQGMRSAFEDLPPLEGHLGAVKGGAKTYDDFRFVRLRSEVDPIAMHGGLWTNLNKGGGTGKFFFSFYLLINWYDNARQLRAYYELHTSDKTWGGFGRNEDCYGRPAVTWPLRTDGLGFRCMPAGFVFSNKGPGIFHEIDTAKWLLATCAIVNSSAYRSLVSLQLARTELAQSYEVGLIQGTPAPRLTATEQEYLSTLVGQAWSLKRWLDTTMESSHAFVLPALLLSSKGSVAKGTADWADRVQTVNAELAKIQTEIDSHCFDLYGMDEDDRITITEGFGAPTVESASEADSEPDDDPETETADTALADATTLTTELLSWSVGTAFGRFDIRLATGERPEPPEPDPFDPLPICSPGMLTGDDGLPLAAPPPGYPLAFPADGVLVDDPGHPRDLTAAVHSVFDVVFRADADARWREAAELLDPKGHDLRAWLSGSFFEHHLKRYSKSRRRAPILWQLATTSGSYSVWLYAHRLTGDTFFHVLNEFVVPKLAHEERRLTALVQDGGPNPTAAARKAIDAQETFVEELRALRDEVARIAPLWNPDLNDGVLLTAAPLWRLVPQHRAWQKELRSAWESLVAGKYDWTHLAMHLWPERVVPKCASDRSLAIAHSLEDVFWVESTAGKWLPRPEPLRPVDELVRERTSPAVKAGLHALESATLESIQRIVRRRR